MLRCSYGLMQVTIKSENYKKKHSLSFLLCVVCVRVRQKGQKKKEVRKEKVQIQEKKNWISIRLQVQRPAHFDTRIQSTSHEERRQKKTT